MRLKVLGCSGGIGAGLRTTSFLFGENILIDAGTGVNDLAIDQLTKIDHVCLTHSHLDHIASLPLLVDSVGSLRSGPITVHALPETIQALRQHVFNWTIWPDFSQIPSPQSPWIVYEPLTIGSTITLNSRKITPLRANHTVPALGFQLQGDTGSLVFSGDTGPNPDFWAHVNAIPDLKHLIMETAFSNRERDLAIMAKHLFPGQLADELRNLKNRPNLWITHLKPSDRRTIAAQVVALAEEYSPQVLENGEILEF